MAENTILPRALARILPLMLISSRMNSKEAIKKAKLSVSVEK